MSVRYRSVLTVGVVWALWCLAVTPAQASAQSLALEDAVQRALARAPEVAAARERHAAAGLARRVVPFLPDLSFEFRAENLGGPPPSQLPRDVIATVSQSIEFGGKRAGRVAFADARLAASTADIEAAEWDVARAVVEAYLDALRAREVAASLREQLAGMETFVAVLRARVAEGVTAEADLRRLEAERGRLAIQVVRAETDAATLLIALQWRVGMEEIPVLVRPTIPIVALDTADTVIADRPDVRAAEAMVALASADRQQARAAAVPDVTMHGGYKRANGSHTGAVGVTIPLGLFDRNRTAAALADGEVSAAERERGLVRSRAAADVAARLDEAQRLASHATRLDADPARLEKHARSSCCGWPASATDMPA